MHSKSQAITHSNGWSFDSIGAIPRHSETLPHPVAARNDAAALVRVGEALNKSGHAKDLGNPLHCEAQLMRDIQQLHAGHTDPAVAQWADMNRAMYAACCLTFQAREGMVLRATDTFEAGLDTTADTLTISQFQPPHPACHVHFGPQRSERDRERLGPALALTGAAPEDTQVDGCYLLQSRTHCESCGRDQRTLGLYIVVEFNDQPGAYALTGGELILQDEDAPLAETLTRKVDCSVPAGLLGEVPAFTVGLLAGLFAYMRSSDARVVQHRDRSEFVPQRRLVGTKKSGKLNRRLERAYDRVEVGPVAACYS